MSRGKITIRDVIGRIQAIKGVDADKLVAELLGLQPGTLATQKSRGTVPYEKIIAFCSREGVSLDDIFLGRPVDRVREDAGRYAVSAKHTEFVFVPEYDVTAAAGHGAEVPAEQIVDMLAFRREWVRAELGVDPSRLAVISVRGDSMEPTLRAGDLVVIDRRESLPVDDGLYVVRIGDGLVVKRVQLLPDRTLVLRSEHPAYQPLTLRLNEIGEQIAVVGRVVWVGRKT